MNSSCPLLHLEFVRIANCWIDWAASPWCVEALYKAKTSFVKLLKMVFGEDRILLAQTFHKAPQFVFPRVLEWSKHYTTDQRHRLGKPIQ